MAFLLFAARKLQLKREINAKNYELMTISSRYASVTNKVARQQETINNMKNQVSIFSGQMQSFMSNQAIAQNFNAQTAANIFSGNVAALSQNDYQKAALVSNAGAQLGAQVASAFQTLSNNLFEQQEKNTLAQLQAEQQQLDLRKQAIESELQLITNEYQSACSAEKEAAKSAAPQFGLA